MSAVVKDYLDGILKGSQKEKTAMQTEILLETATFCALLGWFWTDIAKGTASSKAEFYFWTVAAQFEGAKNVDHKQHTLYHATAQWVMSKRCQELTS